LLSGFSANLIFAEETTTTTVADTTTTTIEEMTVPEALGMKKVGLLPTSPFYFLKEWWRGWKVGWIRDPIKKSEAQLQILSEKLAEAAEIARRAPKPEVLEKAFDNYTSAMDRLKDRMEGLKETSENPNIDKMLDRITQAEIRHSEVLDKILERVPEAVVQVEKVRQNINQILPLLRLKFENQEEFMNRLENKLQELQPLNPVPVGEFRQFQVLEKQGFSSSTIREVINILPVPTARIPKGRLPKTPPPGTETTTTTVGDTTTTTTVVDTTTTTTTTVPDTTTTTN